MLQTLQSIKLGCFSAYWVFFTTSRFYSLLLLTSPVSNGMLHTENYTRKLKKAEVPDKRRKSTYMTISKTKIHSDGL